MLCSSAFASKAFIIPKKVQLEKFEMVTWFKIFSDKMFQAKFKGRKKANYSITALHVLQTGITYKHTPYGHSTLPKLHMILAPNQLSILGVGSSPRSNWSRPS